MMLTFSNTWSVELIGDGSSSMTQRCAQSWCIQWEQASCVDGIREFDMGLCVHMICKSLWRSINPCDIHRFWKELTWDSKEYEVEVKIPYIIYVNCAQATTQLLCVIPTSTRHRREAYVKREGRGGVEDTLTRSDRCLLSITETLLLEKKPEQLEKVKDISDITTKRS